MKTCRISLNLSAEQCQRYYQGSVSSVLTTSEEGLRLVFPASLLRRFVSIDGVKGRFVITFDADCKLVSFDRVE